MGFEFELKFRATAEVQARIRGAYPLDYRPFEMETTYFDTADFALSDRHITLRRRMENGEAVCTVKTPTAGLGRGEWECRCEDIEVGILELCKLGAPKELLVLTVSGVKPICGAKFTRLAGLTEYQGATLEIALDAGILTGGGREIPLCEVEVELKSGDAEAAVAFGRSLVRDFGLETENKSKFRRALALAKGEIHGI
ncbi:MAG: CYTH domain-containing protein [Oscillospiraceae bacterium]|nr:CYTH domain-containing protein [Oscillospiraceae bacterium]